MPVKGGRPKMKLRAGKSTKTTKANFPAVHASNTYAHTRRKFGKTAANRQAVAIVLKKRGK